MAAAVEVSADVGVVSGNAGLPSLSADPYGEFTCLAVTTAVRQGLGGQLVRAAEAHARRAGCRRMQLNVLCPNVPPDEEPPYKQWLQRWYLKQGYELRSYLPLRFEPPLTEGADNAVNELHEMYSALKQVVPCKAISW